MKVALFGGTGFVGSYIVDELISQGIEPNLMVREDSEDKLLQQEMCRVIKGDIDDEKAINETLDGCSAVIYSIGIIREFPNRGITYENTHFNGAKRCIDAAKKKGISRFILMSANGAKMNGTGYQSTKFNSEEYLKFSDLDYTIFRPSLIFGDPRGNDHPEFCTQLKKDMLNLPFPAPNFHKGFNPLKAGDFAMSPIHIKDVASIFVKSIRETSSIKKTYCIGGEAYYWQEIIKTISSAYGKKKWTIPAPAIIIQGIALLFERFQWFPITKDQLTMLLESNVCQSAELFKLFDVSPIPFSPESLTYLRD
jgi:NADH dehydrogenase